MAESFNMGDTPLFFTAIGNIASILRVGDSEEEPFSEILVRKDERL